MKKRTLIVTSLLSFGIASLYKHRHLIKKESSQLLKEQQAALQSLETIQKNLTILKQQGATLSNLSKEITYKVRVFSEESQAHAHEIQATLAPYKKGDN